MNHHINITVVNINRLFQANTSADIWRLIKKIKIKQKDYLKEYLESIFLTSCHISDVQVPQNWLILICLWENVIL